MTILVQNRRRFTGKKTRHISDHTLVADVTSRGPEPWICFSPFFPHGNIPVPFSPGIFSMTVEGIWQALKTFETADVDLSKLSIVNMKGLKRSVRKYGRVLGHRRGLTGKELLSYQEARYQIYLPSYKWILDNYLQDHLDTLRRAGTDGEVILLDYTTNLNINDLSTPLSHAGLIKLYLEDKWPNMEIC